MMLPIETRTIIADGAIQAAAASGGGAREVARAMLSIIRVWDDEDWQAIESHITARMVSGYTALIGQPSLVSMMAERAETR